MNEHDVDVGAGWYSPVEYDEYDIIRSISKEVAEAQIKKLKLERELNVKPKKVPPFWEKWSCPKLAKPSRAKRGEGEHSV